MSEKMSQVSSGIGSLVVGGAILLAGLIVLLDAAVIGLSNFFPPDLLWLSPLIVGLIVLIIGFAIFMKGKSNLKTANLAPHRTTSSLQRDKEFAKEQIR
jgi:drug/metabolite transporter (DMT)-like permease